MTVVIYKDKNLYSDSRYTDGMRIVPIKDPKVIKLSNGILYGSAGTSDDRSLIALLESVTTRKDMPLPSKIKEAGSDVDAICVLPSGEVFYICTESKDGAIIQATVNEIEARFFSIGSGSRYALGAMEAGATPEEAINIACKHDTGCSLPIVKVSF